MNEVVNVTQPEACGLEHFHLGGSAGGGGAGHGGGADWIEKAMKECFCNSPDIL